MPIFHFEQLGALPELVHGVATAKYGNMSFLHGEADEVRQNRAKFFQDLKVEPQKVVVASLVHGDKIVQVDESSRGAGIDDPKTSLEGDTLVTDKPDTYLFMVVADCLALFYYDQVKKVVALAHAGWRGVDQRVPEKTVKYLVEQYGSQPSDILVGMPPTLQKESACFQQLHQNDSLDWSGYITRVGDKYCIDSPQFAFDQLCSAGIPEDNIERSIIDTRTNPEYFSHRRSVEENLPEQRFGCLIGFRNIS